MSTKSPQSPPQNCNAKMKSYELYNEELLDWKEISDLDKKNMVIALL